MVESISYRATRHLPKVEEKPSSAVPQIIGINDIMVKLSTLPSEPLTCETMLVIELNQKDVNIEKITQLILKMDETFDYNTIKTSQEILETRNIELIKTFVKQLQTALVKIPTVWEKYNKDMLFSIKVSRYYQQLEIRINARPLTSADILH